MSQPASPPSEQPHIATLALNAEKALQHGEQLCRRASELSGGSAQATVDVLALDAQVRWMSEAVLDQLKVRREASSGERAREGDGPLPQ